MQSIMRKGFTLIEMLLVIVLLGILASMMMMSSTEAITTAKTTKIVNNLRNLKTAALTYFVENMDDVRDLTTTPSNFISDIAKYLNDGNKLNDPSYDALITQAGEWYVTYNVADSTGDAAAIKRKLSNRAESSGLLDSPGKSANSKTKTQYSGGNADVAMFVR